MERRALYGMSSLSLLGTRVGNLLKQQPCIVSLSPPPPASIRGGGSDQGNSTGVLIKASPSCPPSLPPSN